MNEAVAFLEKGEGGPRSLKSEKKEVSDIPFCPKDELIAFVDGSFDINTGFYGFGCVIIDPEQKTTSLNGKANDSRAAEARNVAGELLATMTAVKYAVEHSFKKITVYHDYEGIAKWYNGAWKAQSFVAVAYSEYIKRFRDKIDISFVKVEAHTGNTLNEQADKLAKEALGIKK